jgi:iron complex outermembrane receptor protein
MFKLYLFRRFLTLGLLLTGFAAMSQTTVSGKVSADDGTALPGVNIVEKGTSNGTVTDADGNYRISVGADATLVFSFVGFLSQEIAVGGRSTIDVTLASDVTSLSEVVVTGYGTQERKEITSSVASIKPEDFNRGTVNDPALLLQGKVAGLSIARPGGDPNDQATIRLRGISTIGANNSPLVVIDGIIGGSLSTVDPNDIASIDVLKDGSAAAIYGSRGSNGVILVTTKSGKAGKVTVEYNGSYGIESTARTVEFMDAATFTAESGGPDLGDDTDWLDVVTQNGAYQVHNISMAGGAAGTTYRASFNFRDAEGIALNSGFSQLNGRINLRQKALKDRLTFTFNLATTSRDAEYGFKESLRYAVISNPTMPVYDNTLTSPTAGGAYGGYAERDIFDYFNPLSIAEQNKNDGKDNRLLTSIGAEWDLSDYVDGLRFGLFYSQQRETDLRGEYYAKTAKFRGAGRNGLASRSTDERFNELFEATLNYYKEFGNTNMALLGGYSYQYFFNEGFGAEGGNFLTDQFTYNNLGAALDFDNGLGSVYSYANSNTLVAFFGRANVSVNDIYFLSASARYEGSSRFGEENKWGLFPAVSAGANLSKLVDMPSVNNLKLRVSWGITGNQPGESYASLQRFGPQGAFLYNGAYVPTYGPVSNANPDLKWETKDELNFGADFALLNNRLSGTLDYYIRTTKDMILPVQVPVPPNLYNTTIYNIGELKNNGFELTLNYTAVTKPDFTYTPGINFATYNTTVESLSDPDGTLTLGEAGTLYRANMGAPGQNNYYLVRVKEGDPLGQLWGPNQIGVQANGVPQFEDINGDGSYCDCDDDRNVVGNGLPNFTYGWSNALTYKNWDINIFFRGAAGHDLVNSYRGFYENLETTTVNNYNVVNTEYFDPSITKAVVNSSHIEDASYFKLDNATLGYTFNIKPGSAVTRFRAYVAGQNLFVMTNYTGVDPEVRYFDVIDGDNGGQPSDPDYLSPGIERRSTYFTTRTVTFGINLSF